MTLIAAIQFLVRRLANQLAQGSGLSIQECTNIIIQKGML